MSNCVRHGTPKTDPKTPPSAAFIEPGQSNRLPDPVASVMDEDLPPALLSTGGKSGSRTVAVPSPPPCPSLPLVLTQGG